MKKINNKGFALVETLIVTAFVVGIFSVMYANFYPMMGEYEKRENYDDISSIYNTNLFKRLIEMNKDNNDLKLGNDIKKITKQYTEQRNCRTVYDKPTYEQPKPPSREECDTVYVSENSIEIDVESFYSNNESNDVSNYYETLVTNLNVEKIYLLPYNITGFKEQLKGEIDVDTQTKEYIDYLPDFKNNPYNLNCRIIVKYKAGENKESSENNSGEYKFATIGVNC